MSELSTAEVVLHKHTTKVLNISASIPKRSRLEANSDFSLSDSEMLGKADGEETGRLVKRNVFLHVRALAQRTFNVLRAVITLRN